MTEQEEFEFRLRLEREKQAAPASPPQGKPNLSPAMLPVAGAEVIANMGSGLVGKVAGDVAGLGAVGLDAITGAQGRFNPVDVKNKVQNALTYQIRSDAGKLADEYNPLALVGKGVDWVGQKAENALGGEQASPLMQGLGQGVHEAINQAPQFIGVGANALAGKTSGVMKGEANRLMQSSLKPSIESLRTGKAQEAIQTLLDEGVNVTAGGVEKMRSKVDALNDAIKTRIENSTSTVDKGAVAQTLLPVYDKFIKQVNSTTDLAAIQKAAQDFINHPLLTGDQIPVQLAQEMKQGTYRSLRDKSYGELKSSDVESQKALARGLKEEIANAIPEVKPLNAAESKLLNALTQTERRVLMDANKNPIGLGSLTLNPAHFAMWMADRSPLFKSIVARMLNSASEPVAASGAAMPIAGLLTASEAGKNKLASIASH